MNLGAKQMAMSSSSASWKSGDGVSDQFPAGLRVLVVDDDPTCLRILEKMLRNCLYEVTKCSRAEVALKLLRDNKDGFDVVISDVHMPDMDGFKLLEHIGLEMDLPVIMMSADDSKNVVMKGVTHGACDYLIKPVRMEAIKNIWQHVVRKKKNEWREKDCEQSGSVEDGQQKPSEEVDYSSSANEGNWKGSKKRKDEEDEADERDDTSTLKKPRVVWSVELHQQFVTAVNQLGIDKAVPKKILELMNVPGLTRENVASHLQKYRLYLKRLSIGHHQNGLGNSFMGPTDPSFGPITSLNALDLQAFTSSGGQPPQSLANIQVASLGRPSTNNRPLVEQRNVFSFESPRIRFGEGQQHQQHNNINNINRQVNLLHGIPTNMDSKQLAAFGNVNLPIHPQSSQMVQPQYSNAVLGRNGVDNSRGQTYAPISQPPNLVDFSRSQRSDFPGNNNTSNTFSLMSTSGMTSSSRGPIMQDEPNYDVFNRLNQNRTDDWGGQSVGPAFVASQHSNMQGRLEVGPSVLVQPGHIRVPSGQLTSSMADDSSAIKSEMGFQTSLFPDQFGQEDLMSALFKQQPEGVLPAQSESDFDFDGYHLDNLPV